MDNINNPNLEFIPAPVKGTDGANPLYNENGPWRWWSIDDIYTGFVGAKKFVPKVLDYVISPENYMVWIVRAIDPVKLIPTLDEIRPYGMFNPIEESDVLFGVGPGTQAQLLRVYLNRSSYPYRLTVDTHCFVGGDNNAYAILYKGGVPSMGGQPVSQMYDASGQFITDRVPLEAIKLDSHEVQNLKVVSECFTTLDLADGTPITVVFYSLDGVPQSKSMLLLENTTYIRGVDIKRRFITNITMSSPWISPADPNTLRFPLNIPANALGLMGTVHYSDGDSMTLPVDGNKFSILGLDGYLSTIIGEEQDLVLRYALGKDEINYAGQGQWSQDFVTQGYKFVTEMMEAGYTVKLFPYPFWDQQLQGYRLRWWLLDLERTAFKEVTNLVEWSAQSGAWDPQNYGMIQRFQINLNLRKVSQAYKAMIHTQQCEITLFSPPWEQPTPWLVANQPMPNMPAYGRETKAKIVMLNKVNLSAGRANLDEWIEDIYGTTYPLIDRRSEVRAPRPNNFALSIDDGQTWTEYPVQRWNEDILFTRPLSPNRNILIRFFRRTSQQGTLTLSIAAMTLE